MHLNNLFNLIVIIVILANEFFHVDFFLALLFNFHFQYINQTSPKNYSDCHYPTIFNLYPIKLI